MCTGTPGRLDAARGVFPDPWQLPCRASRRRSEGYRRTARRDYRRLTGDSGTLDAVSASSDAYDVTLDAVDVTLNAVNVTS